MTQVPEALSIDDLRVLPYGTQVEVRVKGTVSRVPDNGGWLEVIDSDGFSHKIWIGTGLKVTPVITVVNPENWPPQPGDVWETFDGDLYFTRQGIHTLLLTPVVNQTGTYALSDAGQSTNFKARRPELRYRHG